LLFTFHVPDIGKPAVSFLPEKSTFTAVLSSLFSEYSFTSFSKYEDPFVFKRDIGACRQHARAHEFVRCIGGLTPEYGRHHRKAELLKSMDNARVICKKLEPFVKRARGVPDIDTYDATWYHHPVHFFPNTIEAFVHQLKSFGRIFLK